MVTVLFNGFCHCYFYFLYVRTGALRNGCSFEDDLSLGAEGQWEKKKLYHKQVYRCLLIVYSSHVVRC